MTLQPNDLLLFARVAESGSFSRAAERLSLPKSTVSRRVSALERQLGERLLLRTTRKLTLTEFGQSVLDHARALADEVDQTLALALHRQARPSGRLRVSMVNDLAENVLGPMFERFVERYPELRIELDLTPRRVDLVGEGFDLALRYGELQDDATLAARRLCTLSAGVYASRAYLARHGDPQTPQALEALDGLMLPSRDGSPREWELRRGDEVWRGMPRPRTMASSPELLLRLAAAGLGLVALADRLAAPRVAQGLLVRVLPEWQLPPADLWAVFPGRRLMPAKTRLLLGEIEAALQGC